MFPETLPIVWQAFITGGVIAFAIAIVIVRVRLIIRDNGFLTSNSAGLYCIGCNTLLEPGLSHCTVCGFKENKSTA